jgi:YegS/Rv2252/BmrU family lipid kinase
MRILVIGNPVAGRGRAARRITALELHLCHAGHEVEVYLTETGGDARRRAAQVRNEVDRIIVVGGDGTLNEVLNGLPDPAAIPLLLLPMGTANVLARELGLPRQPQHTADLMQRGVIRRLDMGTLGSRRFLALTSAGFDAMVTRDLCARRRGALGFTGYIPPILRMMGHYRAPHLEVAVDGQPPCQGAMVVVSNVRNYGGLFSVTDRARCDSGHLDVCVLHRGAIPNLCAYALSALRRGLSRRRDVTYLTGRSVRIESHDAVPVEVDGDYAQTTPAIIGVQPALVPMIVPAPAGNGHRPAPM